MVREALAVVKGTPTKLVVNDYWRAAIDAGAQHVHLDRKIWRMPMSVQSAAQD